MPRPRKRLGGQLVLLLQPTRRAVLERLAARRHCSLQTLCYEILDNAVAEYRRERSMASAHYTARRPENR